MTSPQEAQNAIARTDQKQNALQGGFGSPAAPMWLDNADEEGLNLLGLAHSLRRRWLPGALIGALLASIVAGLLFLLIPVNSEAVALLRVGMKEGSILDNGRPVQTNERVYEVFKQTQAALLKSPFVLSAALRPPEIQSLPLIKIEEKPLAMLEDEIQVSYPGESELLRVSMKGDNGEDVKKLVNAVIDAFLEEVANTERVRNSQRLEILRSKHRENVRTIQETTAEIQKLAAEIGTNDSELAQLNQQLESSKLQSLDDERTGIRQQLEELSGQIMVANTIRSSRFYSPSANEVSDVLESDPIYFDLKQRTGALSRELQSFGNLAKGGRGNGAFAQYQAQLAALKGDMEARKRELMPRIKDRLTKAKGIDEFAESTQMQSLQTQFQVAKRRYDAINARYEEQVQKVKDLVGFSADLVTKKDGLIGLQEATGQILQEMSRLELNIKQPPRVQLVQRAIIPDTSNAMIKLLEVAAAWLGVFALTIVGITLVDYFSKRLNGGKDLNSVAGLPVVGDLPSMQGGFLSGRASDVAIANSIDSIRTAINFGLGQQPKSIVVTSAVGHEGKTTLASQLAVSFARSGKRTLLIDGDIRNPQQHVVFGLPADRGLCDVLRGEAKVEEIVQATPAENLWILPSGRCDAVAYQVLSSNVAASIVDRLSNQFDFVIVDSGPVLTGPESLIFGQYVEGAVLSTRKDISRVPKVDEAVQRLRSVGINVVGAVVNGTTGESRASQLTALPQS